MRFLVGSILVFTVGNLSCVDRARVVAGHEACSLFAFELDGGGREEGTLNLGLPLQGTNLRSETDSAVCLVSRLVQGEGEQQVLSWISRGSDGYWVAATVLSDREEVGVVHRSVLGAELGERIERMCERLGATAGGCPPWKWPRGASYVYIFVNGFSRSLVSRYGYARISLSWVGLQRALVAYAGGQLSEAELAAQLDGI